MTFFFFILKKVRMVALRRGKKSLLVYDTPTELFDICVPNDGRHDWMTRIGVGRMIPFTIHNP